MTQLARDLNRAFEGAQRTIANLNRVLAKRDKKKYWPKFLYEDGKESINPRGDILQLNEHDIIRLTSKKNGEDIKTERIFGEFSCLREVDGISYIYVASIYPEADPSMQFCLNDPNLLRVHLVAKNRSFAHDFIIILISKIHGTLSFLDQGR